MTPMPSTVHAAHRPIRAGRDIGLDMLPVDLLVGELAHQVPGNGAAELPTGLLTQPNHVGEELLTGHIGMSVEEGAARVPDDGQIVAQAMLDRIIAQDERPTEVGLPPLEDRAEVAEHYVVGSDDPVGWVLTEGLQRIRPRTNDALVPMPVDVEQLRRKVPDGVTCFALGDSGDDESTLLDVREQLCCLVLRGEQSFRPQLFIFDRTAHHEIVSAVPLWQAPPDLTVQSAEGLRRIDSDTEAF